MEALQQLIDKISQYSFLTNILPGAVLMIILKYIVGYDFIIEENWLLTGVMFYFSGIICNRFSSLLIKPLLEALHIVRPLPYKDYIAGERKDTKILTLNTDNNAYRAYIAVFCISLLAYLYKHLLCRMNFFIDYQWPIVIVLLILLFVFSYRKQTKYIKDRIEAVSEKDTLK